jgi:hypothetical protein
MPGSNFNFDPARLGKIEVIRGHACSRFSLVLIVVNFGTGVIFFSYTVLSFLLIGRALITPIRFARTVNTTVKADYRRSSPARRTGSPFPLLSSRKILTGTSVPVDRPANAHPAPSCNLLRRP